MFAEKSFLAEHYIAYPKSDSLGKAVRHIFSNGENITLFDRETLIINDMRCTAAYDYRKLDEVGVAVDREGVFVIILQNMERKIAFSREFFKVKYFHFYRFTCFFVSSYNVIGLDFTTFCLCHYCAKKCRYFYGKGDKTVI